MRRRQRSKLLIEPPSSATGDIAFNLIVFFLVCASAQPDSGLKQSIPRSETIDEKSQETENIEVMLTRTAVTINGTVVRMERFLPLLKRKLAGKARDEDRVVVVKSKKETPYSHWIRVTSQIQQAGGIITLQLEEVHEVMLPP